VPNPIFFFLNRFLSFKRGGPKLMLKKEQPFNFLLLEEGRTRHPHIFFVLK
jgi:hypothetical protein